jgi:hypothetical protein
MGCSQKERLLFIERWRWALVRRFFPSVPSSFGVGRWTFGVGRSAFHDAVTDVHRVHPAKRDLPMTSENKDLSIVSGFAEGKTPNAERRTSNAE